jgi:CHAT domain-containing protein/tetratricopeptide (TPR) repeat protein
MSDRAQRNDSHRAMSLMLAAGLGLGTQSHLAAQVPPGAVTAPTADLQEAARLNQQVVQLYKQGKYPEAIPLAERALAIREKTLGPAHPAVAQSLNSLAELYRVQLQYSQAEPLFQRALAIREKALDPDHLDMSQSLNNLAFLYYEQGQYDQAKPLFQRALAIREKALGSDHLYVSASLNNLALLYYYQGQYGQAELLQQRVLAIREKALGSDHPYVAASLNNLALLYCQQGQYGQAESLYQRVLAIYEKALGKNHPDMAQSLNNLALLYYEQGQYGQAEPIFQRALAIREKALGSDHPYVAITLHGLTEIYYAQGNLPRMTQSLSRGLRVEEKNLALTLAFGSEQQKQKDLNSRSGATSAVLSFALQSATASLGLDQIALTTVLRRKGRVLDAVAASVQTLLGPQANTPEGQKLFTQWQSLLQQQSTLVYRGLSQQTPEQYKSTFNQLEADRQRLEATISLTGREFRVATQPVELTAVQSQIPADAALIEIVQYWPFNPKAKRDKKWGKPRYAAALLRATGDPKWFDLGDAAALDQTIADFRTALINQRTTNNYQAPAQALDQQMIAPLLPHLKNVRHLLIAPDGQLNLIPFEALLNRNNQYLIQRYDISYLTSGRDLLRFVNTAPSPSPPLVLGGIDYNIAQIATALPSAIAPGRSPASYRSADLAALQFGPLSSTKPEAETVQYFFPSAKLLLGATATETALKQTPAPSILHLATHGFFIPDQAQPLPDPVDNSLQPKSSHTLNLENPLLRSGLALAGFNRRATSQSLTDDGVLTALEVAALNLHGTQLVVLSACETGIGEVKVGEGVFGLRRALTIAGAQSQVLSLWVVDDEGTKNLMTQYYQNLKAGQGRHAALKAAQLALLQSPNTQHPYYWAAFLPSGNWTPLKLKGAP